MAVLTVTSCKKTVVNTSSINTNFSTHILSGYFVTSIAFDHAGAAWIGTFKQGLVRYKDGVTTVFNSSNSIFTDTVVINDIAVDSKNNIWIGADALIKYDGNAFSVYNNRNSPIPENFISCIGIDSKDNIWFSSSRFRQGGLVKYDGLKWNVYTPVNSAMPGSLIADIAIDKNDKIWVAVNEGVNTALLVSIDNNNLWETHSSMNLGFSPYNFAKLDINKSNNVVGALDYSLSSLAINTGPQVFVYGGSIAKTINNQFFSYWPALKVDANDNIWFSNNLSLFVYNGYSLSHIGSASFKSGIYTISQALDNKIWVGTHDGIYIN